MRRARGDAGSLSPMVAVLGLAFLLLVGLVIDSARVLNARGRASAYAQEAARAGAGAVDPASDPQQLLLSSGGGLPTVDERVAAYCDATIDKANSAPSSGSPPSAGGSGDCKVICEDATHVVVQTKIVVKTSFLGLIGIDQFTVKGTGQARPVQGVQAGDPLSSADCTAGG